ncbi:glycerol-3-phosphate acyltransferase [Bhargavaea beijingensis]|uniref:glycerol-3-phosphate acyltransferase n=1 Tax=Bhargavaea beijingensis TaxID=426756 RepID=UPI0022255201|nr:glycerol-3-phosphate acyltransferase [Bhargavaea beijingensis]MCW1928739.1 glycerol-3-phosphate acyltransferase [Bhargavaea beijingensis]
MDTLSLHTLVYLAFCWAVGSILWARVVGRLLGADPASGGSGNPGARNAGRLFGAGAFISVFAGDAMKGAAAVLAGLYLGHPEWLVAAGGSLAVLGHVFPLSGGRGGKGVSAWIGAALAFSPPAFTGFVVGIAASLLPLRSVTLAMPGGFAAWTAALWFSGILPSSWPLLMAGGLVLIRHRLDFSKAIRRAQTLFK